MVTYSDLRLAKFKSKLEPFTGVKHLGHQGELAQNNYMRLLHAEHQIEAYTSGISVPKTLLRSRYH